MIEANIKKDKTKAEEALGYIMDLRQTWAEASKIALSQTPQGNRVGQGEIVNG